MAVKTARPDSADKADGGAEIDALSQIRLSRNWSYQQLADDMARSGSSVRAKTLQNLLNYRPKPFDRTLFQIRRYLEIVRERESNAGNGSAAAR